MKKDYTLNPRKLDDADFSLAGTVSIWGEPPAPEFDTDPLFGIQAPASVEPDENGGHPKAAAEDTDADEVEYFEQEEVRRPPYMDENDGFIEIPRPSVKVTGGDLWRIGYYLNEALKKTNFLYLKLNEDKKNKISSPLCYAHGHICRIEDRNGAAFMRVLSQNEMLYEITTRVRCVKGEKPVKLEDRAKADDEATTKAEADEEDKTGKASKTRKSKKPIDLDDNELFDRFDTWNLVDATPRKDVISYMHVHPNLDLPQVSRVATGPYIDAPGVIHMQPGYDRQNEVFLVDTGLEVPPVQVRPAAAKVSLARSLILDELFGGERGFPFVAQADRANASGLFLLPFVREMIAGPTPLWVVWAPAPRTGKTKLIDAITAVHNGAPAGKLAYTGDTELEKRIIPVLRSMGTFFIIDNVPAGKPFRSPALSSAITAYPTFLGRLLGLSKVVSAEARCCWIITGNNIDMSGELAERSISIRLDANCENPDQRPPESFKHPDIIGFAQQMRPQLIWAALTLCQNWVALGRPPCERKKILGGFDNCVNVLGGILEAAGILGFMDNLTDFRRLSDHDSQIRTQFVQCWFAEHETRLMTAAELLPLAIEMEIPEIVSADKQSIAMGWFIKKILNNTVAGFKVLRSDSLRKGTTQYYLIEC